MAYSGTINMPPASAITARSIRIRTAPGVAMNCATEAPAVWTENERVDSHRSISPNASTSADAGT